MYTEFLSLTALAVTALLVCVVCKAAFVFLLQLRARRLLRWYDGPLAVFPFGAQREIGCWYSVSPAQHHRNIITYCNTDQLCYKLIGPSIFTGPFGSSNEVITASEAICRHVLLDHCRNYTSSPPGDHTEAAGFDQTVTRAVLSEPELQSSSRRVFESHAARLVAKLEGLVKKPRTLPNKPKAAAYVARPTSRFPCSAQQTEDSPLRTNCTTTGNRDAQSHGPETAKADLSASERQKPNDAPLHSTCTTGASPIGSGASENEEVGQHSHPDRKSGPETVHGEAGSASGRQPEVDPSTSASTSTRTRRRNNPHAARTDRNGENEKPGQPKDKSRRAASTLKERLDGRSTTEDAGEASAIPHASAPEATFNTAAAARATVDIQQQFSDAISFAFSEVYFGTCSLTGTPAPLVQLLRDASAGRVRRRRHASKLVQLCELLPSPLNCHARHLIARWHPEYVRDVARSAQIDALLRSTFRGQPDPSPSPQPTAEETSTAPARPVGADKSGGGPTKTDSQAPASRKPGKRGVKSLRNAGATAEQTSGEESHTKERSSRSVVSSLAARLEAGQQMTLHQQHGIIDMFSMASEATATLLTWLFYELALPRNAEALHELLNELDAIFDAEHTAADEATECKEQAIETEKMNNPCKYDTEDILSRCPFLRACLRETLRLHPPFPNLTRYATRDDTFPDKVTVPAHTRVTISVYSMGRAVPVFGMDAPEFKPRERWLAVDRPTPSFSLPVFNAGLVACPGDVVALQAAACFAAHVLLRFEPALVSKKVGSSIGYTLRARNIENNCDELIMKLIRRE